MANVPITSLPVANSLGPTTDYLEVSKYINAPGATYQSVRATPQTIASAMARSMPSGLEYTISNLGSVLITGVQPYLTVPYASTITGASMVCAPGGSSVTVDIWRCSYAQFDSGSTHPVSADSICGGNPLVITNDAKTTSTLSGWNTSLNAGDVLAFNISSVSSATQATITLYLNRSLT